MIRKLQLLAVFVALTLATFGQDWIAVSSDLPTGLGIGQISVSMNDSDAIWALAINNDGTINDRFTRSTDGGQTWTSGTFNAGTGLSQIFAIDANTCWAVFNTGSNQGLYKTEDGGATWAKKGTAYGSGSFANVIHFFNDNDGFAQGDPLGGYYELYTTTDGGETWTRVPQADIPAPTVGEYGITGNYSAVGNSIWWGTNQGRVFYSSDKGYTWDATLTPFGSSNVVQPLFKTEDVGIVFRSYLDMGIEPELNVSTDGGATYSSVLVNGNMYARWFDYIPGTDGTWVGSSAEPGFEGISYTLDNGANWIDLTVGVPVQAPEFMDNQTGLAGTWSDGSSTGILIYNGAPIGGASVEIAEDFEAYNADEKLVEQALAAGLDYWTCWSGDGAAGGAEDGTVTSEQAFSGNNSVVCEGLNDFVMLFDDKTAGKYSVEFYMYVPTGFVGYYNILQAWVPGGSGAVWGLEIYYNPGGIAVVTAAATPSYATFNYPYDSWFKMENIIDLNNDEASILIDGNPVATWQWSLGASGGGLNQLAAMDIYAATTNGTPKFFMDDIQLVQLEPPAGDPEITVAPGQFTFDVEYPSTADQNMTIGNVGVVNLDYNVSVIYTDAADGIVPSKVIKGEIVDSFGNESKVDAESPAPDGTDAIVCPAGSLISQPAVSYTSAYSADAENNYTAFQSFTGGGYISALRFWVVDYFFDGTAWSGCDGGDPRTFNIGFYADNGGKPGVEIMSEQISATRVATGEFFSGVDPIYEYTVELSSPVLVPEGWFSVQGISTTSNCWTLMINQPGGAGTCMQFNGTAFSAQDEPLGFCMVGEPYETWLNFLPNMGEVGPGETETVIVQCITANLPNPSGTDVYTATIIVNSNDPANPAYEVPVTLNLSSGGPVLDPPTNLVAEASGANNVLLNWLAPGPPPEPFFEGFEGGTLPTGWLAIDNDNDGFNWINTIEQGFGFEAYEGQGAMTSASFDNTAGPLNPDNYLITPPIEVGAGSMLTYYHTAQDPLYPNDFYYVKLSTTGNSIGDFTEVLWSGVTPLDWEQVSIDLSAYAGNTVYLAFHHTECTDWFWMKIDNVAVSATQTVAQYTPPITAPEISGFPFRTSGMTPTEIQEKEDFFYANLGGKELLGYNVYRDGDVIVQNVIETTYTDTDLTAGNTYTYYVTAVYDEGESGPSNEVSIEIPVGINEIHEKSFTMYPNPANGILYINSDSEIISVKMINYTGQTVFNTVASGNEVKINSDNFASGVYILQVETIEGVTSQKLIIE